jgi:hypothetical protein
MRTTITETPNFSDVSVMLEACYTEMLRSGFEQRAAQLRRRQCRQAFGGHARGIAAGRVVGPSQLELQSLRFVRR